MNTRLVFSQLGEVGIMSKDALLGQVREFEAINETATGPLKSLLTQTPIRARLVINRHSAALTRGQAVLINTDAEGPLEAVEGPSSGAAIIAGFVPWVVPSAGVPVGSTFWLITKGYCKVLSDGGNDVAIGAPIQSAASGQVSAHTAGTNDIYCCGKMLEAIGASAAALVAAYVDVPLSP